MNIQIYKEKAKRTLPDLGSDLKGLTMPDGWLINDWTNFVNKISDKLNLSHMVEGLSSEVGEIVNCVGTELKLKVDRINLMEELGDMYWYVANYANMRNIPLPDSIETEIETDMCLELLITSISDLTDVVKRFTAYNKEIEKVKELEIVYSICTGLHLFEKSYLIEGDEIRQRNIAKLTVRYPEKFEDNLAINRDTDKERQALEQ
jgi:NTP pyrophosphatase (non-canonical NTP hydrolase)